MLLNEMPNFVQAALQKYRRYLPDGIRVLEPVHDLTMKGESAAQ